MSKNITMWWDGAQRNYNSVEKIQAPNVEGQRKMWLPEDETNTGSIAIVANGEYKASDTYLYAFSQANVNVQQLAGRMNGIDYSVNVDANGDLQFTTLPSKIAVTTFPDVVEYTEGETLDYTGIVVKAYDAQDNIWDEMGYTDGEIPFDELVFPITTAHADTTKRGVAYTGISSPLYGVTQPVFVINDLKTMSVTYTNRYGTKTFNDSYTVDPPSGGGYYGEGSFCATAILCKQSGGTSWQYKQYIISDKPFTCTIVNTVNGTSSTTRTTSDQMTMTVDGQTLRAYKVSTPSSTDIFEQYLLSCSIQPMNTVEPYAWGTDSDTVISIVAALGAVVCGMQTLPVQWNRPVDEETLENEFTIVVTPGAGG